MTGKDRLPDDFGFGDFVEALDELDAPGDEDLPTDDDGCLELVTLSMRDLASCLSRLRDVGIEAHVDLPDEQERDEPGVTAAVFVRPGELIRARRTMGIEA